MICLYIPTFSLYLIELQLFMITVNGYSGLDLVDGLHGEMLQSVGLIGALIIICLLITLFLGNKLEDSLRVSLAKNENE